MGLILLWVLIGWACAAFMWLDTVKDGTDLGGAIFGAFLGVFCGAIVGPVGLFWVWIVLRDRAASLPAPP